MQALTYHPLERLAVTKPVERLRYVAARCTDLRVLDLGAYDETLMNKPQHSSWRWLHREIARTAREVLGVDSSEEVRAKGEVHTEFGTRIVHGDVAELSHIVREFRPDLVVAGELIEHTPDTLGWLARLAGGVGPGQTRFAVTGRCAGRRVAVRRSSGPRRRGSGSGRSRRIAGRARRAGGAACEY